MKAKTMSLQGQDYAKVSSRLAEYHKAEKEPAIETSYQFDNGYLITTATVHANTPRFDTRPVYHLAPMVNAGSMRSSEARVDG